MEAAEHWTARYGKPIIFVILTLVAAGAYLASTIPVAVFPEVELPARRWSASTTASRRSTRCRSRSRGRSKKR